MANTTPARESQARASQSTLTDLASNKSTVNPSSTSWTSEAPSKGLTTPADDQSSSLKSYKDFQLSDAERAQDLVGIGSWADSTPESLERVREAGDILDADLELK